MKPIKTAILIAGILVAGLAYNTTFAQTQPDETISLEEREQFATKKAHHAERKALTKRAKHEKSAIKHRAKQKHHQKHSKTHIKNAHSDNKTRIKPQVKQEATTEQ